MLQNHDNYISTCIALCNSLQYCLSHCQTKNYSSPSKSWRKYLQETWAHHPCYHWLKSFLMMATDAFSITNSNVINQWCYQTRWVLPKLGLMQHLESSIILITQALWLPNKSHQLHTMITDCIEYPAHFSHDEMILRRGFGISPNFSHQKNRFPTFIRSRQDYYACKWLSRLN